MKLPATAGIFIYISEIYMKMPGAAGIFIYMYEIYMKMPAAAGNFIYISVTSGGFEPSLAEYYKHKQLVLTIRPSPPLIGYQYLNHKISF